MKQNWLGKLTIVLLWFINFGDYQMDDTLLRAASATINTLVMIVTFQVFRYFFPKIKKDKSNLYKLIFYSLLIATLFTASDFLFNSHDPRSKRELPFYLIIIISALFAIVPIGISMIFSWAFLLANKNRAHELHIEKLKTLNQEAELNELKNQLNPHFLFNALSNIYSIAYLKDEETPDKIMQLSKMLRYVIYETDVDKIRLSKEIDYLNYYIDFQKFKIEKEQCIDFNYETCDQNVQIVPLLLLPFIENAFKHSQISTDKKAWIKMKLSTKENFIYFSVTNTISEKSAPEILNNNGIGLDNICKRLDLVYKDRYSLEIKTENTYHVALSIHTHE